MRDEILDSYDQGYKECLDDVDNYLVRMRIEDPEMREKVLSHVARRKARFKQTHAARKVKRCGALSRVRRRTEVQKRANVQQLSPYHHTHSPADSTTPEDHGFHEEMGHGGGGDDLVDVDESREEMTGDVPILRADGAAELDQGRGWWERAEEARLFGGDKDAQSDSNNNRHNCFRHRSGQHKCFINTDDNSSSGSEIGGSSSSNNKSSSSSSNRTISTTTSSSSNLSNNSRSSNNSSISYNKLFISQRKTPGLIIIANQQASATAQDNNSDDFRDGASLAGCIPNDSFTSNCSNTDPAILPPVSESAHNPPLETRNGGDAGAGHCPGGPRRWQDSHPKKQPSSISVSKLSSIPVSQQLSILIPAGVISSAGLPRPLLPLPLNQQSREATITGSGVKAHAQSRDAVAKKQFPLLLKASRKPDCTSSQGIGTAGLIPDHSTRGDCSSLLVTRLTQPLNTRLRALQACSSSATVLFPEERDNQAAYDLSIHRDSKDGAKVEGRGMESFERRLEIGGLCLPNIGTDRTQQHGGVHSDVWRPW